MPITSGWLLGNRAPRGQGDQYLHRESQAYRHAVHRKMKAFHLHVQLGCIAQGCFSIWHWTTPPGSGVNSKAGYAP
ncbi:MAG: hypothetical protein ACP5E5_13595 [Acidobacteriaceae bacterium]